MSKRTSLTYSCFSGRSPLPAGTKLVQMTETKSRPVTIPRMSKRQIIGKGEIGILFGVTFYMSPPWIGDMLRLSRKWHREHRWQVKIGFKLLAVARGEPLTITEMLDKDFGARP